METFTKEPKLVKVFRERKSMSMQYHKKSPLVFSNVCYPKFAAFGALLRGNM